MKNKTNLKPYFNSGITYNQYLVNEENLLNSSEDFKYREYHELNERRMKRNNKIAEKSIQLNDAQVNQLTNKKLLVITEGWCGDASQIVPFAVRIGEKANMEVKLIYRDQNTDLMNEYLTNGGMAIPVIILVDENYNTINYFAPRPKEAQELMLSMKAKDSPKDEISLALQKWYNKDRGGQVVAEILEMTQVNA